MYCWQDCNLNFESIGISLGEFLFKLGVTLDDVQKALAEQSESEKEQN
jgi:hypothetical protein